MKLIITIDTEEDNWGQYDHSEYTLKNIEKISALQEMFDRYGVMPTYLVTYPVACNRKTVSLLKNIMDNGKCEIGAHCHPWNTPPFDEDRNKQNTMLSNLAADIQYKKIDSLHQMITRSFGKIPTSFRAGRWGFGEETALCLSRLGYKVDSSMLPFKNWTDDHGPNYSDVFPKAFILNHREAWEGNQSSPLFEVPATIGYSQRYFKLCNKLWQLLGSKSLQRFHSRGVMNRLGLLNRIELSPETATSSQMISLTTTMINKGYRIANMFFHTTSLKAGLSPFVQTKADEGSFLQRIEEFLIFCRDKEIESIKLSDAPDYVKHDNFLKPQLTIK